ncbi:MAG: methyltransferase domain-containing protein [Hyphomonadaceae bacterium]
MQMNEGRKTALEPHIERLLGITSLAGSGILEIGGDRWGYMSNRFVELGADRIDTINIVKGWPDKVFVAPRIFSRKLDCRKLTDVYEDNSFNLIFGVAVGEHITGIDEFLEQAKRVLRPGGYLYLHGGPVWSSRKGHHLFHRVDGKQYRFSDKDCPIMSWEHLMNDAASLCARLKERGLPHSHAESIAEWIYVTPDQNRYCYSEICSFFEKSGLECVLRHDNAFESPSAADISAIVANGYAADERFDVSGVTHVMRKV